jgi:hypothetical protein
MWLESFSQQNVIFKLLDIGEMAVSVLIGMGLPILIIWKVFLI